LDENIEKLFTILYDAIREVSELHNELREYVMEVDETRCGNVFEAIRRDEI